VQIFKKVGGSAVRLLFIPGLVEAFFDGGVAIPLFGMPPAFAFALGFILKVCCARMPGFTPAHSAGLLSRCDRRLPSCAPVRVAHARQAPQAVGPALVIQAMFEVQQRRLGVAKGPHAWAGAGSALPSSVAACGGTSAVSCLCMHVLPREQRPAQGACDKGPQAGGARARGDRAPLRARAAIPATVVAAASFDDAIAITGYTLCINLAVRSAGNAAWSVAHGPVSIVLGVAAGAAAALVAAATRLWCTGVRRTLAMVFMGAVLRGAPAPRLPELGGRSGPRTDQGRACPCRRGRGCRCSGPAMTAHMAHARRLRRSSQASAPARSGAGR